MPKTELYPLGVGEKTAGRLAILGDVYRPFTNRFLLESGLSAGMHVADVGCGTGNVLLFLAQQVGPNGRILGVDYSEEQLQVARRRGSEHGIQNLELMQANVYEWHGQDEKFDIVFCRFVLVYLTDPLAALRNIYKAVKPGGLLILEEFDNSTWFGYPPSVAYQRHVELFCAFFRLNNLAFRLGPQVPGLVRQLGCEVIKVSIAQGVFEGEVQKCHMQLATRECAAEYLKAQLATAEELEELIAELERLSRDESFLMAGAQMFQVRALKPLGGTDHSEGLR